VGSFPNGSGVDGVRKLSGEDGEDSVVVVGVGVPGKGDVGGAGDVAVSTVLALSTAREMVGEFQRERALLLVATAVLAANEMESKACRREGKVVVPNPRAHSSIVPPHISV
jgi:hypothetical protein